MWESSGIFSPVDNSWRRQPAASGGGACDRASSVLLDALGDAGAAGTIIVTIVHSNGLDRVWTTRRYSHHPFSSHVHAIESIRISNRQPIVRRNGSSSQERSPALCSSSCGHRFII